VYTLNLRNGMIGEQPYAASLDSLEGTLKALDPLIVVLTLAGYDVRELVAGLSSKGLPTSQMQGYLVAYPRTGLGYGFGGSWVDANHIVDPGTFQNVVALRVLSWRLPADPPVVPVDLTSIPGFQRYRDPADPDGTNLDGWVLLGADELFATSQLVAKTSPAVVAAVAG